MRTLIKPPALQPGDTIGLVAPASPPPDANAIDRSVAALARLGFQAKLAANVRRRLGFLAGTDRERATDLMRMFADGRVQGIVCVRGGYGAGRLLPRLDYDLIRAHPKVFVGYSDITVLHCALLRCAGLVSFHGPMLNSDFLKPSLPAFTREGFLRTVTQPRAPGSLRSGCGQPAPTRLRGGTARGRLVGGNLSLLCSLIGTPWFPSLRRAILFLEDLDEEPYRFDRMLTQLLHAGLLRQVAGIAIGVNQNCEDPKADTAGEYRQTLLDVLKERLLPLKVPLVAGLPFGHVPVNATLPVGVRSELDGDAADLSIIEPGVRQRQTADASRDRTPV